MKRILSVMIIAVLCISLFGCGKKETAPKEISISQLIEKQKVDENEVLTVTVLYIENPVLAVVEDEKGERINLFGITIDDEFNEFENAGIHVGDTLVLKNGVYNEYDGVPEIAEAVLVEKK